MDICTKNMYINASFTYTNKENICILFTLAKHIHIHKLNTYTNIKDTEIDNKHVYVQSENLFIYLYIYIYIFS